MGTDARGVDLRQQTRRGWLRTFIEWMWSPRDTRRRPRRGRYGNSLPILLLWLVLFVGGLIVISVYAAAATGPHLQFVAVGLLAGGAAMVAGALLGFLFGIPRYVSSGQFRLEQKNPEPDASDNRASGAGRGTNHRPQVSPEKWAQSTNLAEVSDWLTKLLVGAGLVQLGHLGKPTRALVRSVAVGLESPARSGQVSGASVAAAGAILVLFSVLGFMAGYVETTLWYRNALNRSDGAEPGECAPCDTGKPNPDRDLTAPDAPTTTGTPTGVAH